MFLNRIDEPQFDNLHMRRSFGTSLRLAKTSQLCKALYFKFCIENAREIFLSAVAWFDSIINQMYARVIYWCKNNRIMASFILPIDGSYD